MQQRNCNKGNAKKKSQKIARSFLTGLHPPLLLARFRDHTMRIFERHNMENVAYWVPKDTPNTLIYIISHASSQAATENWQGFRGDSEWPGVAEASGVGRVQVESVFMDATDFSPMK